MMSEMIGTLYRYNAWANARILDMAAQLSPEQFLAARGASFDSVRDTLAHTMGAQWLYLERWHGRSPRAMPDPQECPDLLTQFGFSPGWLDFPYFIDVKGAP